MMRMGGPNRSLLAVTVVLAASLVASSEQRPVASHEASAPLAAAENVIAPPAVPVVAELAAPVVLTPAPAPKPGPYAVPVLMYHYIADLTTEQADDALARDLHLSPALFAQQLAFLIDQGYHPITARTLRRNLSRSGVLPERSVVLTFDDGYVDAYTNAFRLLRERGLSGTFFVTVNLVGRPGYLTWDQVREMSAAGMDIESHAMDHVSLAKRGGAPLLAQLSDSRRILSERTGTDVRLLAYPNGEYSDETIAAATQAGYDGGFLKAGGSLQSADWAFALRRTRVAGGTGAIGLRSLLLR